MPFNVYVTRAIPEAGLQILREHCGPFEMNPHDRVLSRKELLAAVRGRDGVLCLLTDTIDEGVLAAAGPQCRVFANMAVGFNNVDVPAATRGGILITNTPGVLTESTADLTWALMLAVARRIVESDKYFRTGRWPGWGPMQFLGHDVHGATLGIVGAGRIGTAVARRAAGFDMKLLYCDPRPNGMLDALRGRRVPLEELLQQSDFVSLHVALGANTHHLIGPRELALMKPTAYLVNTTRGPVVDESALVEALRAGRIAGAGLDVYEHEPTPAPGLIELDNVVCIPHLGSATHATRAKMATMAATNLVTALRGEAPPNLVNPDALQSRGKMEK